MVFGANAVAIKISLLGMGPFTTAGIRFAIASAAIALWALSNGKSFSLKPGQFRKMIVLSVIFLVQLSLFYQGLGRTFASRGMLIVNLLPFFVLVLAHFFLPEDRITRRKLFGMLLGFVGIILLFLEREGTTDDLKTGDLLIFLAAILWSVNSIVVKRIIHDFEPFQIVLFPMCFTLPCFFALGFFLDSPMIKAIDKSVFSALLYQGLVTASFGFVAWNSLLQKYGASTLHSFVFMIPISGVFFGWLLLHEPVTIRIILASAFVTAGILVVNFRTEKAAFRFFFGKSI
jgi:drug/metabolite transporter (DMT)-like permease